MSSRVTAWCGIAFVALVVAGSALVSLPGSGADPAAIAAFYASNQALVAATQVAGLLAVPALLGFAAGLRQRGLMLSAGVIAAGELLVAVPVLLLAVGQVDPTGFTAASEYGDDVLFVGVAAFAAVLAYCRLERPVRLLAVAVAAIAALRSIVGVLGGHGWWDSAAPLAFLVLVFVVALPLLRRPVAAL